MYVYAYQLCGWFHNVENKVGKGNGSSNSTQYELTDQQTVGGNVIITKQVQVY